MVHLGEAYDVVVVGGGPAGLAGGLALARARRSVLVVDAGQPRNAPAGHVHNYLGREGTPPRQLVSDGRAEVIGYGGEVIDARVDAVRRDGEGFRVDVRGRTVRARRLLLATGLVDELPDLPGLAGRWGRDVLHCPYCHGWEARERRIGVLATGPAALHQALLWRQWSERVVLLLDGRLTLGPEDAERLAARSIPVVEEAVAEVLVADDALTGVRLASGDVVELDAVVVGARATARTDLLGPLGLEPVEITYAGQVVGSQVPADPSGATSVPGVWVAGNVADLRGQVIASASAGLMAGAAINADLVEEDTRAAVARYREQVATMFEAPAWEARYRERPAIWSGNPNPVLVAEAADLPPGRALDVGSGEGGDAVWLARRGWKVTGVDISTTALQRAARHADDAGVVIEWRQADLRQEPPEPGGYDLVTSQFMHLPPGPRRDLFARLADAVAPGGTLLIVGHHPRDLRDGVARMHFPDMQFTAEEVAASLDPSHWDVVHADCRPRTATAPGEVERTVHDAVLVARRR